MGKSYTNHITILFLERIMRIVRNMCTFITERFIVCGGPCEKSNIAVKTFTCPEDFEYLSVKNILILLRIKSIGLRRE